MKTIKETIPLCCQLLGVLNGTFAEHILMHAKWLSCAGFIPTSDWQKMYARSMSVLACVRLYLLLLLFIGSLWNSAVSQVRSSQAHSATHSVLWYLQPAPIWDNALPVGDGRLGALVFGGANTIPNNGDEQDAMKNAELIDGRHTLEAD
jgi:hypothetical protein